MLQKVPCKYLRWNSAKKQENIESFDLIWLVVEKVLTSSKEQIHQEQVYQNGILSFQRSFLGEKTWNELILSGFAFRIFWSFVENLLGLLSVKKRIKIWHFVVLSAKLFWTLSGNFFELLLKHILNIRRKYSGKNSFWTSIILWMSFRIISGTFSDFEQKVKNRVVKTVFYKCGGKFW